MQGTAPQGVDPRPTDWGAILPRRYLRLGERVVPVYLFFGALGLGSGFLVALLAALARGTGGLPIFIATAVGIGAFVLHGLLRRWLSGGERIVLLEHLLAQLLVQGLCFVLLGLAPERGLDPMVTGMALFMAFGRCGCLIGGCCYGLPSAVGMHYPPECGPACSPPRRFPVQALEIVLWLLLAGGAFLLTLIQEPGSALAFVLIGYGQGRLVLERLRGDQLPRLWGFSYTALLAAAALLLGLWALPGPVSITEGAAAVCAAAVLLALYFTRGRWMALPAGLSDAGREALHALGAQLEQADDRPQLARVGSWTVAMSRASTAGRPLLLSASCPSDQGSSAEARLLFDTVLAGAGVAPALEVQRTHSGLYLAVIAELEPQAPAPPPQRPAGELQTAALERSSGYFGSYD